MKPQYKLIIYALISLVIGLVARLIYHFKTFEGLWWLYTLGVADGFVLNVFTNTVIEQLSKRKHVTPEEK